MLLENLFLLEGDVALVGRNIKLILKQRALVIEIVENRNSRRFAGKTLTS
jgi:hypothetical protein